MATLVQELRRVLQSADPFLPNDTRRILLKAVLQGFVLDYLYNHRRYRELNFYGGTCLHVVYGLNRLSEDIDLDNTNQVDLEHLSSDLLDYFQGQIGYRDVSLAEKEGDQGIFRILLKFPLLYELELTPHQEENLHLKIEVSQHQQAAEVLHTPIMYQGRSFVPAHFSKETMMAGKMLACLERSFQIGSTATKVKGRDYYDLLWFMQQKEQPLEKKLATDGKRPYTTREAMVEITDKIEDISKQDLAADLYPLFETRAYIESWIDSFHANFKELVRFYC